MGLERCSYCTAPIYVRLAAKWNDNGTVTGRFAGSTRVVQIYAAELNHILDGISERIGLDISRVVLEGERKAGVLFTSEILGRAGGVAKVVSKPFSRWVIAFMVRMTKNAGLGDSRLSRYRRGKLMVIECESPFNIPVFAGDMLGAFEAFHSTPGDATWQGDDDHVTITISAADDVEHVPEERLKPVLPPTLPSDVKFMRCPRCGIPLEVTRRYKFDLRRGLATEVQTGKRIVTVIIDSLNAVFAELESELGDEVKDMIVELEASYVRDNAPEVADMADETAVSLLLDDLRVKGMGNPTQVAALSDGGLRVRVDNPFSEELLAGRVLGVFEALRGEKGTVEWTPDTDGFTIINVSRDGSIGDDNEEA